MPIYEYECKKCGHTFDYIQKISDPALNNCPNCNDSSLQKLVSAPSFKLKGSGWYETDFKGKSNAKSTESTGDSKQNAPKADKKPSQTKGSTDK